MTSPDRRLTSPNNPSPCLTISDSDITFAAVSRLPFVNPDLKESVARAAVLLVPQDGHGADGRPCFPEGTTELFAALMRGLPEGTALESALSDDDYVELALHDAVIHVATILVEHVLLPVIIHLVATRIYEQLGKRTGTVKASFIAEFGEHSTSIKYDYDGPADVLETTLLAAIEQQTKSE